MQTSLSLEAQLQRIEHLARLAREAGVYRDDNDLAQAYNAIDAPIKTSMRAANTANCATPKYESLLFESLLSKLKYLTMPNYRIQTGSEFSTVKTAPTQ